MDQTQRAKMKRSTKTIAGIAVAAVLVAAVWFASVLRYGFSTQDEPTAIEASVARAVRHWAVPSHLRYAKNPLPLTPGTLAEARAHFADHCATCHGNDGRGSVLGRKMYPRTPDLTRSRTQSLSDGELFSIIEKGVRLTGMPGFGAGTAESEHGSWALVHFIRHLPKLTSEELDQMQKLNPKSPEEWRQMQEEEAFLAGENEKPAAHDTAAHEH